MNFIAIYLHAFAAGIAALTPSQPLTSLQWHTVSTAIYPKKRDDIVFVNTRVGFYGTGNGDLYRTQDGGESWGRIWARQGTFIRSLGFIDSQHGFLGNLGTGLANITDATPLYETWDGGATWAPAKIGDADVPGVCSIDILKSRSIHEGVLSDRLYIHAAGRANGPAKVLRSENGGESWSLIDLSNRAGMILDVKFLDPNIGFVFAATSGDISQSHALILKTTDGGRTWRDVYQSTRLNEIIWKGSFVDSRVGYATVQNDDPSNVLQRIVKSIDGGEHWTELPLVMDKDAEELGIGFVSADKGWVGTSAGGFETHDGGKTWVLSTLAPKANRNSGANSRWNANGLCDRQPSTNLQLKSTQARLIPIVLPIKLRWKNSQLGRSSHFVLRQTTSSSFRLSINASTLPCAFRRNRMRPSTFFRKNTSPDSVRSDSLSLPVRCENSPSPALVTSSVFPGSSSYTPTKSGYLSG